MLDGFTLAHGLAVGFAAAALGIWLMAWGSIAYELLKPATDWEIETSSERRATAFLAGWAARYAYWRRLFRALVVAMFLFGAATLLARNCAADDVPGRKAQEIALWSTAAGDLVTTELAIARNDGRVVEGNPVMGQNPWQRVGVKVGATALIHVLGRKADADGRHGLATAIRMIGITVNGSAIAWNVKVGW